jgi:hypothetical protein
MPDDEWMRERLKPSPLMKPFFAISVASQQRHKSCERRLSETFGDLHLCSPLFDFSFYSRYYDEELGGQVWKYFIALQELLPADRIVEIKLAVEEIQTEFAEVREGRKKRIVNIDPGYLNGWQVILSTVKNHSHRLYLGQGVYCEMTLIYRKGAFQPLPWTFPDYTSPLAIEYFSKLRMEYRRQLV